MKIMSWILVVFSITAGIYFYLNYFKKGGKIITVSFRSSSLENNCMGESPDRKVSVYLPKDYDKSDKSYPCLYFLHGFGSSNEVAKAFDIPEIFDNAIEKNLIPPMILVFPDSHTKFKGSFYTNSEHAGRWADYIGIDLVDYIDSHFRTIRKRESRAISGHSMGGNGALKIAMLFPDVFSSVYALSPSILYWDEELVPENPSFKTIENAKSLDEVVNELYAIGFLAVGSTYSANPSHPPFNCDMPVRYTDGVMRIDSAVFKIWDREYPLKMAETRTEALAALKGIGFDWGKNDEFKHLPVTCRKLSDILKKAGITHFAEEYDGNHMDGISLRIRDKLIPFLRQYLQP